MWKMKNERKFVLHTEEEIKEEDEKLHELQEKVFFFLLTKKIYVQRKKNFKEEVESFFFFFGKCMKNQAQINSKNISKSSRYMKIFKMYGIIKLNKISFQSQFPPAFHQKQTLFFKYYLQ